MKKRCSIVIFFVVLTLISSCSLLFSSGEKDEKIKIINQTGEKIVIYCYEGLLNIKSNLTKMGIDEIKFVDVIADITYYAEGEISKTDYGNRVFKKIPSNYDLQQTWTIK
jgi:hypothetical protein